MPTLNYTTKIAASKTIAEMQNALAKHGASSISTHFEDGLASGLSFSLPTPHGVRVFSLPVDCAAVWRLLRAQKVASSLSTEAQAQRVAWRVAKDWLLAQLALIEAQMATLDQVMLPYLHVDGDKTLYAAYRERESALALESPS